MLEYLFRQILSIKYKSLKDDSISLDKYKLNIHSPQDLLVFWKFIVNEPGVDALLQFMFKHRWLDFNSVIEIALDLGHWKFIKQVQEVYSLDIYLGSPKYHFNELIVLKSLKHLRNGKDLTDMLKIMENINNFSAHHSREVTHKLIESFNFVCKNERRELNILINTRAVFNFFKEKGILSEGDQFLIFKQIVKSKNILAIDLWSDYITEDTAFLFIEVADFDFLKTTYEKYSSFFKKRNYMHTLVKVYCKNKDKICDLIYSLNFLVEKNLIEVREDITLLKWISSSRVEVNEKFLVINSLVKLGFLPPNELLYKNQKYPDLLISVLSKGNNLKELSRVILGAKSSKAQTTIKDLIGSIQDNPVQNKIVFYEFAINQLSIPRDLVLNALPSNLIDYSLELLSKLKYIALQFPVEQRMKILLGLNHQHETIIKEIFEVLSFINAEPEAFRSPLPDSPGSLKDLMERLVDYKKNIQKQNIAFGLDLFAKDFEEKRFQEFYIKVPKNALELTATGMDFNNCLRESHHAKYVTDILHRKTVIMSIHSLHSNKIKYCIAIDLENEKISEAKAEGQINMSEELIFCFDLFLKDLNYGKKWL